MKIVAIISVMALALLFVYWKDFDSTVAIKSSNTKESNQGKGGKGNKEDLSTTNIAEKWELPAILKEVSGIAYLDEGRFACVQDEEGKIFIYNTSSGSIENEIPFGGPGDYEGLTLVNKTAYVVRADGVLYEVDNIESTKTNVKQYKTHLTVEQNVEGLCYDKQNNRLLVAIKDDEPGNVDFKGVYGFDLKTKKMPQQPVYSLPLKDQIFVKSKKSIRPSAINIHPVTGDIYIVDGPSARLLIMDNKGALKTLHTLGKQFVQAEGITFSPGGDLYISNEGKKEPANILRVKL